MKHFFGKTGIVVLTAMALMPLPAHAQQMTAPDITASEDSPASDSPAQPVQMAKPPPGNSKTAATLPLIVTAAHSLEWHRNQKFFVAHGNAVATHGEDSVTADTLTAHYSEKRPGSGMKIDHVEAEGQVTLASKDSKAYGDKGSYDIDKGYAVLTGNNLKMVSPDQIVTARDRFEYWTNEGRLTAIGGAKAVRGVDTLEGETISAILKKNEAGQQVLDTLTAENHVVITTPTETATGASGIYHANTNKAELKGGVKIHRGPNILEGDRAEVDLTTNISQIFGGPVLPGTNGNRVRGVFYPNSENLTQPAATNVNAPLIEAPAKPVPAKTKSEANPNDPANKKLVKRK